MLVHMCKNCGKLTTTGYVNKYDEHFCTINCYARYCDRNCYNFKLDDIKFAKTN